MYKILILNKLNDIFVLPNCFSHNYRNIWFNKKRGMHNPVLLHLNFLYLRYSNKTY